MRTLLIDDLRNIEATQVARTYKDGIKALEEGNWDILYLDHDLGCKKSGYDILSWLEQNIQLLPKKIEIVSMNPVGRIKMEKLLLRLYGRVAE